jgi:hypothetical protein
MPLEPSRSSCVFDVTPLVVPNRSSMTFVGFPHYCTIIGIHRQNSEKLPIETKTNSQQENWYSSYGLGVWNVIAEMHTVQCSTEQNILFCSFATQDCFVQESTVIQYGTTDSTVSTDCFALHPKVRDNERRLSVSFCLKLVNESEARSSVLLHYSTDNAAAVLCCWWCYCCCTDEGKGKSGRRRFETWLAGGMVSSLSRSTALRVSLWWRGNK